MAQKRPAAKPSKTPTASTRAPKRASVASAGSVDPASEAALDALPLSFARPPDMPVGVAQGEFASLARLAATAAVRPRLEKIGLKADIATLGALARGVASREKAWQKARAGVKLSAAERKLVTEAERLDAKLLAGGRWACREDEAAQKELSRIAEGAGLADTVQDLLDEVTFWREHETERATCDVTDEDLARASELAGLLSAAAAKESNDVEAAHALELRNRCFWAADAVAAKVREGGRYAFRDTPKLAAKFVSRYRAAANRRSRAKKHQSAPADGPAVAPTA